MIYRRIDGVNRYFDDVETANKAAGCVVVKAEDKKPVKTKKTNKRK